MTGRVLPRRFYSRPTIDVAKDCSVRFCAMATQQVSSSRPKHISEGRLSLSFRTRDHESNTRHLRTSWTRVRIPYLWHV